ncbi:MAG: hypothetical protein ACREIA_10375 [Opitutaceae bacterium]
MMLGIRPIASLLLALPLAFLVGGCGENPVSFYEAPKEDPANRAPGPLAGMRSTNAAVSPATARLEWTKPAAWSEKPGSEMRLASFGFTAPDGRAADISVISFPDAAGGLLANINRWRGQVGLEPVADGALETTAERIQIAGLPAWFVDLAGIASGSAPTMSATPPASGPTRIIGAIVPLEGTSWFFKMMGPDDVVAGQRETFEKFIAGIRAVTPAAATPPSTAPLSDPHAGVPGAPPLSNAQPPADPNTMDPSAVTPPPEQDGFHFDTPAGWQAQETTQFRLASFSVPGGDGVAPADVSVSAFPGMEGQDLANVNRWRGQAGLEPVDAGGLEAITTRIEGGHHAFQMYDFESPDGILEGGRKMRLLAAMLKQDDTIWFFKMTGESGHVASQREAFVQFLRSFHLASADAPHAH